MASDELTPETAMDLLYPLLDDSKSVSIDDILSAWERDRERLAVVTAQRDALADRLPVILYGDNPEIAAVYMCCGATTYHGHRHACVVAETLTAIAAERSATMDSACPECFPDNDYGLRIEGFVCRVHRARAALTVIAAERGKGEE